MTLLIFYNLTDDSLYNEFGNYIGPEIESESDRESKEEEEDDDLPDRTENEDAGSDGERQPGLSTGWLTTTNNVDMENQVVRAEDKKYYPTAEEFYGEEVETLVMDEDELPLEQPIIKPVKDLKFELGAKDSSAYVSTQFLLGLMSNPTLVNIEIAIRHAIQERLPIVVVINKADGLTTELKLPRKHAYHKLSHLIEAINTHSTARDVQIIDPALGNFASCLWGDYYFDPNTGVSMKKQPASGAENSFVQCVLEPLYEIYRQVIGEHKKIVEATLAELGVTLSNAAYSLNVRPMLRLTCSSVFGTAIGFTDMLVHHIPSAKAAGVKKVDRIYSGAKYSTIYQAMENCDSHGPLMVNVTKLCPKSDCSVFYAFGESL
ncbi:hypothetical protein ACH5RR_005763 [Cinchona calisaya]|uniref:116kDa U5 small nuclear ribonucleoprotein component N-terminal domain-containing protein n=1 Tax=Cinchona calisaya TaxID=153742 RepID=A0ABD3AM90_9GENT